MNKKILIVEHNKSLQETLKMTMEKYFKNKHIFLAQDGKDALWQASDINPDFIIMNYDVMNIMPEELIKRLNNTIKKFNGIIVYTSESEIYEEELNNKLASRSEFREIKSMNYDQLIEKAETLFLDSNL